MFIPEYQKIILLMTGMKWCSQNRINIFKIKGAHNKNVEGLFAL